MTFEEFLTKKKIDLAQFQTAEPGLFMEFRSHYSQMGPKSFDHSKKFLFNKLRRAYHLKEESKPAIVKDAPAAIKEILEVNEIASQAEPLLSPSIEATVYTPRFRVGGTVKKEEAENENQKPGIKNQDSSEKPKPTYIPRFKSPAATKEEAESGKLKTEAGEPKPAYVPRFKAPATKQQAPETPDLSPQTSDPTPVEEAKEEIADKPKQAYVPRFKAPVTAKPAEEAESGKLKTESGTDDQPKPAYVPRFKSAPTKPTEEPGDENSSDKS